MSAPVEDQSEPLEAETLEEKPLEAESPEAKTASKSRTGPVIKAGGAGDEIPWPIVGAVLVVVLLLFAGAWGLGLFGKDEAAPPARPPPVEVGLTWQDPVWLPRAPECVDSNNGQEYPEYAIGYEPGLDMDAEGNLFYTAHKDLRWAGPGGGWIAGSPFPPGVCQPGYDTSWDYYASWFFVSQDGGTTWGPPPDWGAADYGSEYGGDEGDIAVDNNQRVYFLDTYLEDNWIHRWDDGGDNYIDTTRQNSQALDDRPWLTAQGDQIVHYLGNSGTMIPDCQGEGGRYWYYRSTDGGRTFSQCYAMPGGWSHFDAERDGEHIYVIQEASDSGDADIQVRVSDDTGLNWAEAQIIAEREANPPEGFPIISSGPAETEGLVGAIWADAVGGRTGPWKLHMAMSWDYGQTWSDWDLTPFKGLFFYPTIDIGPDNTVGLAFYGIEGDYTVGKPWHLYAAMVQNPEPGQNFTFVKADPTPLHTVTEYEVANNDVHALHDFFEIAVDPNDLSLNIAYQYNLGQAPFEDNEEQRYLMFVKGTWGGLNLTSPAFGNGEALPAKYTADGEDLSPPLAWAGAPEETVAYALTLVDTDAPSGEFVHWLLYDLDGDYKSLGEGVPTQGTALGGAHQGTNDFGGLGYGGPDPPQGETHSYTFTLYALDKATGLPSGASLSDLEAAMAGHILAKGKLTGTYSR